MNKLIALLERIDDRLAKIAPTFEPLKDPDEVDLAGALKIGGWTTAASLSKLAKDFPSIRTRRGRYSKSALKAALAGRETIRKAGCND